MNTEVADAGGHATIATNQITLAAGTYRFRCGAIGHHVTNHQLRLQNTSDAATVETGLNAYTNQSSVSTFAEVSGRFTIASTKTFELQHRSGATKATTGFGISTGWGTEVYAVAEFWKEA